MGRLTSGPSRLPGGSRLVQVGEQVGRARLSTAAGPPALHPEPAPSPWLGEASHSQEPPLPPRAPVWALRSG